MTPCKFLLVLLSPRHKVFTDMDAGQVAGTEIHGQLWFLFLAQMGLYGSLGSCVLRHEAVPGVCLVPVCLWT